MWELIQKGGPVMYALLACSFVSLTFVIERLLFWFMDMRGSDSKTIDQAMDHLRNGRLDQFFSVCRNSRDPVLYPKIAHVWCDLKVFLCIQVNDRIVLIFHDRCGQ